MVTLERMESQDHVGFLELKVRMAPLDPKARRDLEDYQVLKGLKEIQDRLDFQVMLVAQVHLGQKDWMVCQASMEIQVPLDHQAKMVLQERLVCKVCQVNRDPQDNQVFKGHQDPLDPKEMLVPLDLKGPREVLEVWAHRVLQEYQA